MSENIPEPSTSASVEPKKPSKRKIENVKLPTPPPDPTENNNETENVFEYLDSLTRSTSTYASLVATEEAFDHFVKLYKLMKQMFEIREQNAKLHRRIRDLEQMNNLTKLHKELERGIQRDCPELDKDTAFAESILESILLEIKKEQEQNKPPQRVRSSILRRQRYRSGSATEKSISIDPEGYRSDKPSKVSKWTKVKAAFKWEKASNTISDIKSQDGGLTPVNKELACYLRVPSTSDDTGHSPVDSILAEISTPGSLSTTSSNEDFHRMAHSEGFRSSEDEHSQNYIPQSKDEQNHSKTHPKFRRNPWAKMKDIIQTRNSFKKKHRLSAQSDDIQIDVELCSDNEDVFLDENKSKSLQSSSPCSNVYMRSHSSDIPSEIIARYQFVLAEDALSMGSDDKKISKWVRVKKAFLSPEIRRSVQNMTERENIQNIEDEIQNHYRKLQKKLSLEFHEKRNEWERMKQSSPSTSNTASSCTFIDDNRDAAFVKKMEEWHKIKFSQQQSVTSNCTLQMTRENDLPPEFKKKMQEWERIKKLSGKEPSRSKKKLADVPRWKSLSGNRSPAFELPPLSDDFKKKLEEWRQIKASGGAVGSEAFGKKLKDKTPSPKLSRKNSSPKHSKKSKDHPADIKCNEKDLNKTDQEKRTFKNRKNANTETKQEVLVHTPSGFYRFEGISRKFTQKLYEWEKAQGISPESSTFALLASSCAKIDNGRHSKSNSPSLIRSKSADSIAKTSNILACPIISHQPSSLSLNDVPDFDKESLSDSKSSSMQFLNSQDDLDLDEPEALIVEVEDYVEETAAPLRTFIEEQKPVYQREEMKAMCEGETVAAPKVRRSESTKAQANYNIIEEIFVILGTLLENEHELKKVLKDSNYTNPNKYSIKIKEICEKETIIAKRLVEKVNRLQEANAIVTSSINKEESSESSSKLFDILDAVQDLSLEIYQMSENLDKEFNIRLQANDSVKECNVKTNNCIDTIIEIRNKMMELRRHLSYVCAATDLTAPGRKRSSDKKKMVIHKTISSESKDSRCDTSDNSRRGSDKKTKQGRYIKSETCNIQSQAALKKRIKYRQKSLQNRSLPDTDEEDDTIVEQRKNKPKKLCRTRSTSESSVVKEKASDSDDPKFPMILNDIIVPTETNFVNSISNETPQTTLESPVTLFVKTTRKLFTPIGETSLSLEKTDSKTTLEAENTENDANQKATESDSNKKATETVTHLPPLPSSPGLQRKVLNYVSPSIRMMLAKYNQKLSEQEATTPKSGGSSGSASPVAWRSPTAERRVKAQTEKYQEEIFKLSPLLGGRREVQKSASVGYINSGRKQVTVPIRRDSIQETSTTSQVISKSHSTNLIQNPNTNCVPHNIALRNSLTLNLDLARDQVKDRHSPEIRQIKLQKAKEEFFKSSPVSAPPQMSNDALKFPIRNRLSQISVDSESSYDSTCAGALIKSASAGMINIDPDAYKQIDPEFHESGYVSLPRTIRKPKEGLLGGKFAFSNIASKFRKVRMRRGKDKMNAVSTLCRQSLVVDISPSEESDRLMPNVNAEASSGDVSPSSSRSGSWIKKPKLFKR